MKSDNPAKHFIIPLAIALVLYAISYSWIEHRRARNGPWAVAFTNAPGGVPEIVIDQPKVGVSNVQIMFSGEKLTPTNTPVTVRFGQARSVPFDVPFGKCVFMDPTFLPGTLTFHLFGHEIELLPRVLMLDHQEHPWRSGEVIKLATPERGNTKSDESSQ
jgi:hypothetical protein